MKLWLVFPLFALAQASCYDYEYYDPTTGASQGNACAAQQAKAASGGVTTVGQPTTLSQPFAPAALPSTTFGTSFAAPYAPVATTSVSAFPGAPVTSFAAPATSFAASAFPTSTVITPPAAVYTSPTTVAPYTVASAAPYTVASTVAAPYTVASTVAAPYTVASTVAAAYPVATPARTGATSSQAAEIQRLTAIAQKQNRQHEQNQRIVKRAAKDLSKASLINRVVAGAGNALPWYPAYRLNSQRKVADAYKSEKQIANRNANEAYQRYLSQPTGLNMLISKYSDLNADLKGAAYQYNVIDSGTFGQRLSTGLLGLSGGGLWNGVTQIITQKQQSEDLEDIQRQMKRVARQIKTTVQTAAQQAKGGAVIQPGSVQQRMMAMSTYGPQASG